MVSTEFNIKLLPGSLILVEADGYTAEIFKPYVQNGRIHVFNMVPCTSNPPPKVAVRNRRILGDILNKPQPADGKKIHILEDIPINHSLNFTMNNSTTGDKNNSSLRFAKETIRNVLDNKENCFSTPVKKVVKTYSRQHTGSLTKSGLANAIRSTPMLGPNVKVIRLHRKSTPNTPKRLGKVVPSCSPSSCTSSPMYAPAPMGRIPPPATITKWRNCLTPQRTYSRFAQRRTRGNFSPGFLRRHSLAVHQAYNRHSKTQGYFGDEFVHLKRLPLIVDDKVKISPVRFKRQLQNWTDITKTDEDEYVPKTKVDYRNCRDSFTLLTSSTKQRCYGERLQRLFKRRCTQRRCVTDRSFVKFVVPLEPLEEENYHRPNIRRELILDGIDVNNSV